MAILNYSLADITQKIILNLPVRFTKEQTSNVYKLFEAIASGFNLNTIQIDELFRQTNLSTASSGYVDDYINGLSGIGRFKEGTVYPDNDETDEDYIERYKNTIYVYNSTKLGLKQIIIDMLGKEPIDMYTGNKKGAFYAGKYYYNEGGRSIYGNGTNDPFTGYIEFARRPAPFYIDQLVRIINKAKASGVLIYLVYPNEDDLTVPLTVGSYERSELI